MKKSILALAMLFTLGFSLTAHAYEEPNWLIDRKTYVSRNNGYKTWYEAESEAEVKRWAENNCTDIKGIADEDQRYRACVKKVCDFLTYDLKYTNPMIYYTLRDGKGVCADYTVLTKALCDEVGIKAQISRGILYYNDHVMLKVTVNGIEHYSDPTGVDSGATDIYQMTPGYAEDSLLEPDNKGIIYTGYDEGEWTDNLVLCPDGYRMVKGRSGKYYYIPDAEVCQAEEGLIDYQTLYDKYGID